MEAIRHFAQSSMKKSVPELRPGDTVRVHQKIREGNKSRIQVFEGVVIAVRGGKSINASFVVRYVHKGTNVGVEKTFPLHSPNVEKVERLKSSKVRQARLFYLRERFGRAARMKDEVRNASDWYEVAEETAPVEESPAEAAETDMAEEPVTAQTEDMTESTEETPEESAADTTNEPEAETTDEAPQSE